MRSPTAQSGRADLFQRLAVGPLHSRLAERRHLLQINAMIREGELRVRYAYSANIHQRLTLECLRRDFETDLLRLLGAPLPGEFDAP